jgi:hypothetical protein
MAVMLIAARSRASRSLIGLVTCYAKAVALADVMPSIESQLTPGYLQVWGGFFPGQIPEQPVLPEALDGDDIDLEGHR